MKRQPRVSAASLESSGRNTQDPVTTRVKVFQDQDNLISSLLRNLPAMVYRITCESPPRIEFLSAGAWEVTGSKSSDIIRGQVTWGTWIHPRDLSRVEQEKHSALQQRKDFSLRYRVITESGERWVHERGKGFHSMGGELLGYEGVVQLIDDERESDHDRDQLARIRHHLEIDDRGVAIFEEKTAGLREYNDAFQRVCGMAQKEVASYVADKLRLPEDQRSSHEGSLLHCHNADKGNWFSFEIQSDYFRANGKKYLRVTTRESKSPEPLRQEISASVHQALLEDMGICLVRIDENLLVTHANEPLMKALKRSHLRPLSGRGLEAWVAERDQARLSEILREAKVGDAGPVAPIAIRAADGGMLLMEVSLRTFASESGKQHALALRRLTAPSSGRDLSTKASQTESSIWDDLPVLVWQGDLEGRCTFVNRAWCAITGRTRGEEADQGWTSKVCPEDLASLKEARKSCLSTGDTYEVAYRLLDPEGTEHWFTESGSVLRDASGQIYGQIGIAMDFALGHRLQEELAAWRGREQSLEEISPVGIFRTDCSGRCNFANNRWCEIADLNSEESHGMGWTRTIHPDDREAFAKEWSRFAVVGDVFNLNFRISRRDGHTTWVLCQAKLERDAQGEPIGVLGTLIDFTARHHLEQEQLKLSKLESLGVLAGGIAHDFNNQLTPVILNLAHVLEGDLSDESRERLLEAKEAADEASTLTRQLLTFAKGGTPVVRSTELPPLVRSSMNFALRGTKAKGELAIEDRLWPVRVDRGQISQVIQNLVINSCHAMPEGGKVTLSLENVHSIRHSSLSKREGRFVRICVSDTGQGISPEHIKRIFDPYFTTKETGHGLGLASALSIIRKHGGEMGVESELGRGTAFSIFLPASDAPPEEEPLAKTIGLGPKALDSLGRKRKILVMDDEPLIRASLRILLGKLGYQVVEAEDGLKALQLYQAAMNNGQPISLALMDLTIPDGMGGKEAIAKLKEIDTNARAIVFSGYSNDPIVANFREYGFCDSLQKPFQPHDLAMLVDRHIAE